jgi:hypothetical protein
LPIGDILWCAMLNSDKSPRKTSLRFAWVLALSLISGCAHNISSDLLHLQPNAAAGTVFQTLVLGVDPPKDSSQTYQLEKFVEALREARLFKAVEYPHRLSSADLILTSFSFYTTNPLRACLLGFEGQLLTIGTLGLFPQICKSELQVSFVLVPRRDKRLRKPLSLTYETRSIMGWAALFYLPFREWTANPPNERRPDIVKNAFHREADDIQKLLQQ